VVAYGRGRGALDDVPSEIHPSDLETQAPLCIG
jgi:hypothetical protein